MSKKPSNPFREDDLLGKFPPKEMTRPEDWLLTDDAFNLAWREATQGALPSLWHPAERKIRSDRAARMLLMRADESSNNSELPDDIDVAFQLLDDALPFLPEELAARVRQFLGD